MPNRLVSDHRREADNSVLMLTVGRWRATRGWWMLAGAAAAASVATWLARFLPVAVGGAVVAVVAAMSATWSSRGGEILGRDLQSSVEAKEKLLRTSLGRLPKVREVDDLTVIGVHPAALLAGAGGVESRTPVFVRRDASDDIEEAVRTRAFVLIVGDSTAGKSRAAFEAARAVVPGYTFLAPDPADRTSVRAALTAVGRERFAVVWLDDLERYLGEDGLTARMVQAMTAPGPGRGVVLLATIRAQERARYGGVAQQSGRADQRTGRDVIALAHEIRLDRRWSAQEVERAKASEPDSRVTRAIASAERYGIAECLLSFRIWRLSWENSSGLGV